LLLGIKQKIDNVESKGDDKKWFKFFWVDYLYLLYSYLFGYFMKYMEISYNNQVIDDFISILYSRQCYSFFFTPPTNSLNSFKCFSSLYSPYFSKIATYYWKTLVTSEATFLY
jgi:hypothetical protein